MERPIKKITVFGCGSWGSTISILLSRNGIDVITWEYNRDLAYKIQKTRTNEQYLKGSFFPENIRITSELEEAIGNNSWFVFAVPSHTLRDLLNRIEPFLPENSSAISLIKGIENNTLMRVSEIIKDVSKKITRISVLSGPSHAEEVSKGMPTTIVAASPNYSDAITVQNIFMNNRFRVYTNPDIIGVELGGALKNVIAIAAGISDGLGFGDNTRAAIITRGLEEIRRLGNALGAKDETFAGLAGVGDLIVTCGSQHSRNRFVGFSLGQGKKIKYIVEEMTMVAEGVKTALSGYQLGKKTGIELPIIFEIYKLLYRNKSPEDVVSDLLNRPAKPEKW